MIQNITAERIESYYNRFFKGDFERYFEINNIDGIPTITDLWDANSRCRQGEPTVRKKVLPAALAASIHTNENVHISSGTRQSLQDPISTKHTVMQNGDKIDDFTFSAMFASVVMMQKAIWGFEKEKYDGPEITDEIISATNYPVVQHIFGHKDTEQIMNDARLWPYTDSEKELFLNIAEQVFPFMKKQMMPCILQWNNHALEEKEKYAASPADHIAHAYNDMVFSLMRQLTKQQSLLYTTPTMKDIEQYYKTSFMKDLKTYFNVEKNRAGYDMVLYMHFPHNKRLVDGNPSDSGIHNIIFTSILLYMIIVEKSLSPFDKEFVGLLTDFFRKSKWLLISSGLDQLSPMKMLEEAGLAPRPEESLIFLSVMKPVFEFMRSLLGQMFNTTAKSKDDNSPLSQFLSNGHVRKRMFKCLDAEIELFKADLYKSVEEFLEVLKSASNPPKEPLG